MTSASQQVKQRPVPSYYLFLSGGTYISHDTRLFMSLYRSQLTFIIFTMALPWCVVEIHGELAPEPATTNEVLRLDLENVLLRAAEDSFSVRQAKERIHEAEGSYKVERSKLLPKLYGTASQKRQDRSTAAFGLPEYSDASVPEPIPFSINYPGLSSDIIRRYNLPTEGNTQVTEPFRIEYDHSESTGAYDFFDASLRLGMAFYDREQYTKYKAAEESMRRSDLEIDYYREDAMTIAAQLFYAVLVQKKSMEALQAKVDLHLDKLNETRDLLSTGTARPLDVKKEEVALASAQNSLLEATKRKAIAERELKRQLNLNPATEIILIGDLFFQDVAMTDRAEMLKSAMDNRIDVQLQQYRERLAAMNRDGARYSRHPDIRGMGSLGRQGNTPDDTVEAWMIGIFASIPIWDSFERQGKIQIRESQYQQSRFDTEDLNLSVENEIDTLQDELHFTKASVELLKQSVDYLKDNRQYLEDKVTAGTGKRIDLLSAEVDLAQTEYKLIEAIFNHQITRIKWYRAIGNITEVSRLPEAY